MSRSWPFHKRVSRLNYSRRCAEASAVQAHMKQEIPLAPGMEIGYVIRDAKKWEVDPERTDSGVMRIIIEPTFRTSSHQFIFLQLSIWLV